MDQILSGDVGDAAHQISADVFPIALSAARADVASGFSDALRVAAGVAAVMIFALTRKNVAPAR